MAYKTVLTDIGRAKIAYAIAHGTPVPLLEFAVGDAGGVPYEPTGSETALVNELYRGLIHSKKVNDFDNTIADIISIIDATVGGWWVREVGLYDTVGDMIAISNYPEQYKPTIVEGSPVELEIINEIKVVNIDVLTLAVDPSSIYVSTNELDAEITNVLNNHSSVFYNTINNLIQEAKLDIYDEGVLVSENVESLDFRGSNVRAEEISPKHAVVRHDLSKLIISREHKLFKTNTLIGGKYRFTLNNPYTLGNGSLLVFQDLALLSSGTATGYDEVDSTHVDIKLASGDNKSLTFVVVDPTLTRRFVYDASSCVLTGGKWRLSVDTYTVGDGSLLVWNDVLLSVGKDYDEVDSTHIDLYLQPPIYSKIETFRIDPIYFTREDKLGGDALLENDYSLFLLDNRYIPNSDLLFVFEGGGLLRNQFDYQEIAPDILKDLNSVISSLNMSFINFKV